MIIAIASDHAGYEMKESIKLAFPELDFIDFGAYSTEAVDYPDTGFAAADAVVKNECQKGILICGSGIGMSITANKVPGIRAALCVNTDYAKLSRMHNDSNILVLPARFIAEEYAVEIVKVWLQTEFEGGRHQLRIDKLER